MTLYLEIGGDGMTERPRQHPVGGGVPAVADLTADLAYYTGALGFRLDTIFPADNPAVATLSGHGVRLRLERRSTAPPGVLRLLCRDAAGSLAAGRRELTAPNGVRIMLVDADLRSSGRRPRMRSWCGA